MTRRTIIIEGPEWHGRRLQGYIKITLNRKTASLQWDIGEMDVDHLVSDVIHKIGEQNGFNDELMDCWNRHRDNLHNCGDFCGTVRWGCMKRAPIALVEECAALIERHWREALALIPYSRQERIRRDPANHRAWH